jgi:hypothetical protein
MAARQISWSLAVAPGVGRNPTVRTKEFQSFLNWISRYWYIDFPYQPSPALARINFVFARVAVMETDIARRITYISDRHKFGSVYQQCRLLGHEFFHMPGGWRHLGLPHIMHAAGGTAGNFTQADCAYMSAYPWRSGLRPWHEPNAMAAQFQSVKSIAEEDVTEDPPLPVFTGVIELSEQANVDTSVCRCRDNRKHTWRTRLFGHPVP